ncbi:akirin-2-like [Halichondria panicea]|uniref:akirin-2-like n=1 Tax=Halichondria panicea TaxID=6063 RepID=UPI00312BB11D
MACVTLKRPIDVLGSPHAVEHEPVSKRKRCGPSFFPTTPPGSSHRGDGYRGFSHYGSPMSSRVVKRVKRKLEVDEESGPSTTGTVSPFIHATPPLPTGKLVAQLEQELKRLQRRKTMDSSTVGVASTGSREQPLFTLRQVTTVCQRMLKEREEQVRVEYDRVLVTKLSEQYDAFVKFSHDQVERRLAESTCSYVS